MCSQFNFLYLPTGKHYATQTSFEMLSNWVDSLKTKLNESEGLLTNRVDSLEEEMFNRVNSLERKIHKSEGLLVSNGLGLSRIQFSLC